MGLNPLTTLIAVLATLFGIVLKTYLKIQSMNVKYNKPMFSTLMEIMFLICISIFWIMIFSRILH